jgi:hypothetical protein
MAMCTLIGKSRSHQSEDLDRDQLAGLLSLWTTPLV